MPGLKELRLGNFAGGLNLRDAQAELALNESPDLWNVTLDERGGVSKRLGFSKHNFITYVANYLVSNVFYWQTGQNLIVQCSRATVNSRLYKDTNISEFKTFTTDDRCAFADFAGKLCIVHPIDGFFTYDGTTVTAIATGPRGSTLAVWQNKLWSAGDPTNKSRVTFSAAGDPATWNASVYIDVREKDNAQV